MVVSSVISLVVLVVCISVAMLVVGLSLFQGLNLLLILLAPPFVLDFVNRRLLVFPLKDRYKRELKKHSVYYNTLDETEKRSFERRVQRFINRKEFIWRGTGNREVSDEMKTRIAAVAMRLTSGHPTIYFDHFTRILIYPDSYYSTITKLRHQGEVNMRGFIVLSWRDFLRGYDDFEDGIHLGYHEMAHALQLENAIETTFHDFLDAQAMAQVQAIGKQEQARVDSGAEGFFRASAFFNEFEFFAVTVESFFERPAQLQAYHAGLYSAVATLLKQDPLSRANKVSKRSRPIVRY